MFSYRQGMNEIIAVIYFVFSAEKVSKAGDIDKKADSEIASNHEKLIKFMFNQKHLDADVFIVFERVMSMGIKELYGTIDDITTIKSKLSDCVGFDF
jgi:predicted histidine transporter YuiF (NhaC family)